MSLGCRWKKSCNTSLLDESPQCILFPDGEIYLLKILKIESLKNANEDPEHKFFYLPFWQNVI